MPIARITSILGGIGPTFHLSRDDQYLDSIAIDPESPGAFANVTGYKSVGTINPTRSQSILTTTLSDAPMWITGAATSTGVFVYGSGGSVYVLSGALTPEADDGALVNTGGIGNGGAYYNDYFYAATGTDLKRLGKLSTTQPTLASYWVTGLSNTAFTNTTYPSVRNITYPNHPLHFHNDGKLYIGDYDNTATDRPHGGLIHWIKTATDGTGGTSGYAALILPPGFMPIGFESYGTDLAILCVPEIDYTASGITKPGDSALFLWDTISSSYYRHVTIKDALATAIKNKNGELFIVTGNMDTEVRLLKFLGRNSFQTIKTYNEGSPCPQGAIDVQGDMIMFGGYVTVPSAAAGGFSYGSRTGALKSASHFPMRITDVNNTLPIVSALRFIRRSPYPVLGWRTDTSAVFGLDQIASATSTFACRFRSKVFNIGQSFSIKKITVPLVNPVNANTSISVVVIADDAQSTTTLQTINSTNFPNSEQIIAFRSIDIRGYSNFFLDFTFGGTGLNGLAMPITIEYEIIESL